MRAAPLGTQFEDKQKLLNVGQIVFYIELSFNVLNGGSID